MLSPALEKTEEDIMMTARETASMNIAVLAENPYPGRLVGVGKGQNGNSMLVTAITGRSKGSRNRIYVPGRPGQVTIEKADPSIDADTSNRFYDPICRSSDGLFYIASNGVQTDLAGKGLELFAHDDLARALTANGFSHEDDHPNDTPRITAACFPKRAAARFPFQLAILKRSPYQAKLFAQNFDFEDIPRGFGYFLSTYMSDGNPLPHYTGEPFLLSFPESAEQAADMLWGCLDAENRVSLAVMEADADTGEPQPPVLRNKYAPA
jgi:IMP cyclohydrolase